MRIGPRLPRARAHSIPSAKYAFIASACSAAERSARDVRSFMGLPFCAGDEDRDVRDTAGFRPILPFTRTAGRNEVKPATALHESPLQPGTPLLLSRAHAWRRKRRLSKMSK